MARKKKVAEVIGEHALGEFEGFPVSGVAIIIPSLAGGLVEPMKVQPVILHAGEEAYITLHLRADEIRHKPLYSKDDDETILGWTRIQRLDVLNATFVDEELVRDQLDEMARRVAERKEAEETAKRRETGNANMDDALHEKDHAAGRHSELVKGCPDCDSEQAAADAEAMVDG